MFQEEIIRYIEILKDIYDNNKFSYQAIYNLINNSHFIGDIKPIENTNDYITTLNTFQVIAGNKHTIFHNNNQRVIDINTNIPNLVIHYTKLGLYLGYALEGGVYQIPIALKDTHCSICQRRKIYRNAYQPEH